MPAPLLLVALALGGLGGGLLVAALVAARRRRWVGATIALLLGLLGLALGTLASTVSVAIRGYRALTREEVAAVITTEPTGPHRFRATLRFPDGQQASFDLAGDAIYVEAHIVKWHPVVNVLGLHTAYRLDRVGGRWERLTDERTRERTIYPLAPARPLDLFDLARRLRFLAPLVDAEYGSATFSSTREPAELEVRVSTTGLLVRPVAARR